MVNMKKKYIKTKPVVKKYSKVAKNAMAKKK